jgi:glycosyltransferase involved in cell wall biosynthesis
MLDKPKVSVIIPTFNKINKLMFLTNKNLYK